VNPKKPTWMDVKQVIAKMGALQLRKVLEDLYGFSAENKAFFHSHFLSDQDGNDYLKPYKARIRKAICPKEPWKEGVKLSAGKRAISEFKKANGNLRDTLSLMLYYIKSGNDLILKFGNVNEPFYNSMESMYARLVKSLIKQKDQMLTSEFMPQLETEFKRVKQVGWGYGDTLKAFLDDLKKTFPKSSKATCMKQSTKKTLSGHWRIVWMALWDREYIDLLEPGYIRIDNDGGGEFQFGVVTGSFRANPVKEHFDSKWEGSQECDEARGEIYGALDEKGELRGTIDFWDGDESEYRAVRFNPFVKDKKPKKRVVLKAFGRG